MNFLNSRLDHNYRQIKAKVVIHNDETETFLCSVEEDEGGRYIHLGNKDMSSGGGYRYHKLKIYIENEGTLRYCGHHINKFGKLHDFRMHHVDALVFVIEAWDTDGISMTNFQSVEISAHLDLKNQTVVGLQPNIDYCRDGEDLQICWYRKDMGFGMMRVTEKGQRVFDKELVYSDYVKCLNKIKTQRIRNFL